MFHSDSPQAYIIDHFGLCCLEDFSDGWLFNPRLGPGESLKSWTEQWSDPPEREYLNATINYDGRRTCEQILMVLAAFYGSLKS